jgi:hypothetical protein
MARRETSSRARAHLDIFLRKTARLPRQIVSHHRFSSPSFAPTVARLQRRGGAMANSDDEAERASFASLPPALQHAILRRLPVDARARCACVCRGWRDTLMDVSVWTRLDVSRSSGVRVAVTDAVLCGASGLARGALTALDVSGCGATYGALLAVVAANAGTLIELRACSGAYSELPYDTTEALLRAAPRLRVLHADVSCAAGTKATRLLRNEAPFGPLRVHRLYALYGGLAPAERDAAVTALASDIAAHDSLSSLKLWCAAAFVMPAVLDAVVDAVLLRRVRSLELVACSLSPTSAPALGRLLRRSALTELRIYNDEMQLLDAPAAALLADALRANSTLTTLALEGVGFWRDAAAATLLLGALTGHPSLHELNVCYNVVGAPAAVVAGAALSAVITANTPALHELHVRHCMLGDAGLGPLVDALPGNRHLRVLNISENRMSEAFARERLLPAVRANSALRKLCMGQGGGAALEAEALVAERAL